jgi:hypothetical protein
MSHAKKVTLVQGRDTPSLSMRRIIALAPVVLTACYAEPQLPEIDDSTKLALASAMASACPDASPSDEAARNACADALTELAELRDAIADPVLWGGQPADMPLDRVLEDAHLTDLNPRVWRRMYLSTFMFSSTGVTVEQAGKYRVMRIPVRFRNELDAGDYPYPFWHSEKKWRAYETSLEVLIFFDGDRIVGGSRSSVQDQMRPHHDRTWDGAWTWDDGAQPKNALYQNMFSTMNPQTARLENAYRALEDTMRSQNCTSCHDPANSSMMHHLELLNYPNQALSGRHEVVRQLEGNAMPPGVGVADQITRLDLIRLARDFATAGDDALSFDGENLR